VSGQSGSGGGGSNPTGSGSGTGGGGPKASGKGNGGNPATVTGKPASSATNNDGGSSSLAWILIGVAVLAALSAGAVLYRMKRAQQFEEPGATPADSPRP
jgi:hypothetical protein